MSASPSIQLGTDGNWAIKEDNLLAYKKDGTRFFNKEFDFTRGSLATFVDKDGLIKVSGVTDTELVTNGDFSDGFNNWNSENAVLTLEGVRIESNGSSGSWISQSGILTSGKTYKLVFEIKEVQQLGSLRIGFPGSGVSQASITEVGIYTLYFESTGTQLEIVRNSAINVIIDNISVKEIQTDVPRIDFKDDTTGHLLLEPQSTNLVTYSEDFSQSIWTKNDVLIEDGHTAPDGTNTAYKVTEAGSNAYLVGFNGQNTNKYKSIWARTVSGSGKVTLLNITTDTNALFDITEQWQRFEIAHSGPNFFYAVDFRNTGATLSEVLIWGAQLEALPYATSYIPTSGSTVTRNAEVCNNSGSVQDFNSEEGVLYAEISQPQGTLGSYLAISNGNTSNRVIIGAEGGNIKSFITGSGSSISMIYSTYNANTNKVAIKYKSSSASLFYNGSLVSTTSSAPSMSGLSELKFTSGGSGQNFYGKVKNIKVFKRALSDGELYLLTVPQYQSYQEMATALNYTL